MKHYRSLTCRVLYTSLTVHGTSYERVRELYDQLYVAIHNTKAGHLSLITAVKHSRSESHTISDVEPRSFPYRRNTPMPPWLKPTAHP